MRLLCLWLLSAALLACARRSAPSTAPAHRVVSLSPSTTEAMFAVGAKSALVGRSRYCDYPPEVVRLPDVGGYIDPSFEAILALRPDLVTGARGPSGPTIASRLEARGIRTYFPETESVAGIEAMILGLGERSDHAAEARRTVAEVDARVAAVERAVKGEQAPRVLFVFGLEPIVVAGPGGFEDELLRHAGARNVIGEGGRYPTIGMERVLVLDPDVVLDASADESRGAERITIDAAGWRELRAVKLGRVVLLRDEVVLRPGPRIGEGLAVLARALHPGVAVP